MPTWLKNPKAIVLVLFCAGLTAGMFLGKIDQQLFGTAAMVVLTGYFATKKDVVNKKGEVIE